VGRPERFWRCPRRFVAASGRAALSGRRHSMGQHAPFLGHRNQLEMQSSDGRSFAVSWGGKISLAARIPQGAFETAKLMKIPVTCFSLGIWRYDAVTLGPFQNLVMAARWGKFKRVTRAGLGTIYRDRRAALNIHIGRGRPGRLARVITL